MAISDVLAKAVTDLRAILAMPGFGYAQEEQRRVEKVIEEMDSLRVYLDTDPRDRIAVGRRVSFELPEDPSPAFDIRIPPSSKKHKSVVVYGKVLEIAGGLVDVKWDDGIKREPVLLVCLTPL